jgi:putative tryptophan/tyrosine transport system substrate-binding protein
MKRRDFLMLAGGAVAIWPGAGRAQQPDRRRVGILLPASANDSEYPTLLQAFLQKLKQLGWTDGSNVRIETRWAGGAVEANRRFADELMGLAPDVIFASGNSAAGPLLQATRAIPIVFAIVPDPVGAGLVDSLARPGGNATGFTSFSYDIGGKWLELLKEMAPGVKRVGVLRDPDLTAGVGQWSAVQTAAPSFGLEASPINLRDAAELEQAMATFARHPNGGLVVTSSGMAVKHRATIVMQAAKLKLPAIYYSRPFVSAGGLASFGSDRVEQFRSAAGYVDRILKGEKPSDLPVQTPTQYELVVNLKTAKALGLSIGPALLARANEVIE